MENIHDKDAKKFNIKRIENMEVLEGAKVEEVDPKVLINSKRFDIMAKYIYGKFVLNNIESKWAYKLYENHLWVFNRYDEDDGSGKKGIKNFINSYHKTLESIKENGFDEEKSIIPVDENYVPIDGAHRIATAALLGEKVKVQRFKGAHQGYDYRFFKDKGMLSKWSDEMAYEYCHIKGNTHLWIIRIRTEGEMKKIIDYLDADSRVNIYYEKKVKLNNIRRWFSSTRSKKIEKYLAVFLMEVHESVSFEKLKNDFQVNLNCGVYITRTREETIALSQKFFRRNSSDDVKGLKKILILTRALNEELIKYLLIKSCNRGKLKLIDLKQKYQGLIRGRGRRI